MCPLLIFFLWLANPRTIRVSKELIAMLYALPKTGEKVFGKATRHSMECNFKVQR
jgi:hypothetical protein